MNKLRAYHYACSAAEAVALLRRGPGRGMYIGGGTDLLVAFPPGVDFVVDINGAGLGGIQRTQADELAIGAAATLQQIVTSALCRRYAGGAVAEAAAHCGNRAVRSVATVGGNLCSALPSADMVPILLALDAEIEHTDGVEPLRLPLAEFFLGPRRTLLGDRLLTRIVLPARCGSWRARACKLGRTSEDISLVHVAVGLEFEGPLIKDARIALGAVAPRPCRAEPAEDALRGLRTTVKTAETAIVAAAQLAVMRAEPIDDHRASAAYRRAMVGVLTGRLVRELCGLPAAEVRQPFGSAKRRPDRLTRELQAPDYGSQAAAEDAVGKPAKETAKASGFADETRIRPRTDGTQTAKPAAVGSGGVRAEHQPPTSPSPPSPRSSAEDDGDARRRRGRGGQGRQRGGTG